MVMSIHGLEIIWNNLSGDVFIGTIVGFDENTVYARTGGKILTIDIHSELFYEALHDANMTTENLKALIQKH